MYSLISQISFIPILNYTKKYISPEELLSLSCMQAAFLLWAPFFFKSNTLPLNIYLSGYMNNVGDIYAYEKDYPLAREYYRNGASLDYENWRSNYSLACISLLRDELSTATDYFVQSNAKHPSEYSYLNLSNIYVD